MKTEVRFITGAEVRLENGADGKPSRIVGYAAVYNSLSQDLGGFRETIAPGAFKRAMSAAAGPDVRGRYNHEQLLARTKSGTLRLMDDAKGLRYEIDIPDTSVGRDVAESIRRGDVDGSSFCFRLADNGDVWRRDGDTAIRELREISDLLDVGPVDTPAYLGTEGKLGLRTLGLRSLPGASRKAAVQIIAPPVPATGLLNLRKARLKMAEMGLDGGVQREARFYVESIEDEDALCDACLQAANAIDSVISLSWKMPGMDDLRAQCVDAMTLAQALCSVLDNPDSAFGEELAGLAGDALTAVAKACKGIDHPIARLAAVVCLQAAEQCAAMAGEED